MKTTHKQIGIVPFSRASEVEEELIGSKAVNLGKLLSLRVPVPNGFIITTAAFEYHCTRHNLYEFFQKELAGVDAADSVRLENASKRIRSGLLKPKIDEGLEKTISKAYASLSGFSDSYVAIRSSSPFKDAKSGTGQYSTFLNIRGKEDVVEKVKYCWASLFSPQNLFYILSRGMNLDKLNMAVIVQRMIQSEVSGVMFTINPIDNDKTKMSIEAVLGLGEVLVDGQLTPDSYLVDKKEVEVLDKHIVPQEWMLVRKGRAKKGEDPNVKVKVSTVWKTRQKLENKYIKRLVKVGKVIEDQLGQPQDIEWAYEGGKVWIVQSRPVITLKIEEESWKKTPTLAALRAKVNSGEKEGTKQKMAKGVEDVKDAKTADVLLTGKGAFGGVASGEVKVVNSEQDMKGVKKGTILVVPYLSRDHKGEFEKVVAVVTDEGGRESYAAFLCRKLGIPCIIDAQIATKVLRDGEMITVDGSSGEVVAGTTEEGLLATEKILQRLSKQEEIEVSGTAGKMGETEESISLPEDVDKKKEVKTATKVFVNMDDPNLASNIAMKNVDGAAVINSELIIKQAGVHPRVALKRRGGKDQIVSALSLTLFRIAKSFDPRPVIYKLSNLLSDDYLNLQGGGEFETTEGNPMLGMRGASRFIAHPEEVELELEAVRNVRNKENIRNIWIAIPHVRTYKELREVKYLVSASGFKRSSTFKLFITADVPSAVIRIEKLLDIGVDGVIINIDELSQLILGVDKSNPKLQGGYKEPHPAVMWAIERVIKACNKAKVHSQVNGHVISTTPKVIKELVKWGLTSITVNSDLLDQTREYIAEAEKSLLRRRKR